MSEEMKHNETTETAEAAGKGSRKKLIPLIAAAVVVLAAIAVGIGIYNTPANRISRQMDLGNRYLENEQYEEAILAFERVIAIDDRCVEAYAGAIEAYAGKGSQEELEAFYDRALAVVAELDEESVAQNMDNVVDIYLAADKVYETDPQKAAQILAEGYGKTGENGEIQEHLINDYLRAAENEPDAKKAAEILEDALAKVGDNQEIKDNLVTYYLKAAKEAMADASYEEALAIYDRLLELDSANAATIKDLCGCLNQYIDFLMECGQYDTIRALAEKYEDVAADVDLYLSLAKAYEGLGNIARAIETLEDGYDKTQEEKLSDALNYYIVRFEDPQLEGMFREDIGKASGNIYVTDVSNINSLTFIGNGKIVHEETAMYYVWVRYFDSPEEGPFGNAFYPADGERAQDYYVNGYEVKPITTKIYGNGDVSVLTGIQAFSSLSRLKITQNKISDISAISGLVNLEYLDLHENNISDISALSGLKNLTYLDLHENSINDISALSGLTNLNALDLRGNDLRDINALSGLKNLEYLDLDSKNISDISILRELTNLISLSLGEDNISDISVLCELPNLVFLDLDGDMATNEIYVLNDPANLSKNGE